MPIEEFVGKCKRINELLSKRSIHIHPLDKIEEVFMRDGVEVFGGGAEPFFLRGENLSEKYIVMLYSIDSDRNPMFTYWFTESYGKPCFENVIKDLINDTAMYDHEDIFSLYKSYAEDFPDLKLPEFDIDYHEYIRTHIQDVQNCLIDMFLGGNTLRWDVFVNSIL